MSLMFQARKGDSSPKSNEFMTFAIVLQMLIPEQCLGHFDKRAELPIAFTCVLFSELIAQSIAQLVEADGELPFNPRASRFSGSACALASTPALSHGASIGKDAPLLIACKEFNLDANNSYLPTGSNNSFEDSFACNAQYHMTMLRSFLCAHDCIPRNGPLIPQQLQISNQDLRRLRWERMGYQDLRRLRWKRMGYEVIVEMVRLFYVGRIFSSCSRQKSEEAIRRGLH